MSTYPLADSLSRITGVPLYNVQKCAIEGGYREPGYGYLMEMGLGKTRTGLVEVWGLHLEGLVDFLVLIAPKSLIGTWEGEAEEINFPYKLFRLGKNAKQDAAVIKEMLALKAKGKLCGLLLNYESIPGRGGDAMKILLKAGRVYCPLDESIRIKARDSVVAGLLNKMFEGTTGHFRRILSGRPAPQGPHDLWSQFRFIGLNVGTFFAFRNTYCSMGGWMGKKVVGSQNLDKLRAKTGHAVFRAKKKDWTDLPSKLPATTRDVEMLPNQRAAYLAMMHDFVMDWGDRPITVEMAVTAKAKLAQISSGFIFDNDKNYHWLMDFDKNPKLKDLEEFMDMVDTKIIIPYHHRPTLEALKWLGDKRHAQEGYDYAVLQSGMDTDAIEFEKLKFNTDPNCRYIFLQSSAHKYGHTLLGIQADGPTHMPCHTMYFFENTYNLDTRLQTEDRDHRHGQRFPCSYTDVAVSREDRLTVKALQKKERMEEALLREITGVGDVEA